LAWQLCSIQIQSGPIHGCQRCAVWSLCKNILSNMFLRTELLLLASYPSFWKFIILKRHPLIYFFNSIVTLQHLLFFILCSVNVASLQFVFYFHKKIYSFSCPIWYLSNLFLLQSFFINIIIVQLFTAIHFVE
jgi:hypothetical protein